MKITLAAWSGESRSENAKKETNKWRIRPYSRQQEKGASHISVT